MLRIGLAGIGTIAEVYINLFVQNKIHGGVITALSSRNMSHLAEIQKQYSLSQVSLFSDYTAMLNSGLIDVVLICTPPPFAYFHGDAGSPGWRPSFN